MQAFADFPDGVSARDLASYLDLSPQARKKVSDTLNRLQSIGLLRRSGEVYRMARGGRVVAGVLRQRRRKTITFVPDLPDERRKGPIRISAEDTGGAYDGDRILVSISRTVPGEVRSGKVEMLLRRGLLKIVGRLHHGFKESWVESLDEKFLFDIDLEGEGGGKGKGKGKGKGEVSEGEGSIVIVEIVSYPSGGRNPRGRIVEVLGPSDDAGLDIQIVIHKHDLPHIFPEEVLNEAAKVAIPVSEKLIEGRLDLRSIPTVTIDGETARDFDDAITLRKLENGNFDLGVHIADVSHYVKEGGPLDTEARIRGTSVYFPERAIPMLPEELSNDICSLKPRVERLTLSALMEIDEKGHVVGYELRETVIQSNERMTYTDVNKLLRHEDPQLAMRYADLIPLFRTMEELARVLIRMRERRGAIDFNLPEAVFEFDDEGRIAGVLKAERNIAHRIIEEFMLLANETVASHLEAQEVPSLYRIHEDPKPQRVLEFAELANAYGYRFPESHVSSKDYQNLSKQLEGKPEERVLAYSMLRSLERARYSARNMGHFGLAAPKYTHFTSPIRRYPDLIVHRLVKGTKKKLGELELIALDSSDRERAADAAEMEIDEWRKAKFMAERVGDEFEGTIVNVREFGFFVELDEFYIDGLVSLSSLGDDYYRYDERRHTLTGARRRRSFKLGDSVRVRVDRVNVDRHLVDFAVVS